MKWDLSDLYLSFDSPEFLGDIETLDGMLSQYHDLVNCRSCKKQDDLMDLIDMRNNIGKCLSKLSEFSELSFSVNTSDNIAASYIEKFDEKRRGFEVIDVGFVQWLTTLNIEKTEAGSQDLKEYSFHIKELLENAQHLLSPEMEKIVADMQATGSTAWAKLHSVETSSLTSKVDIDESTEEIPFAVIRSMAYKDDVNVRKKAYKAELEACSKIEKTCAACLNGVKGEAITISSLRGYDSLIDMTLKQSRMSKRTLDTMMSTIKEYLPVFRSYYKKKSQMLGHSGGLPFYDLFAPINDSQMRFNYDETKEFIVTNFGKFSDELSDFAKNAFDNRWIDAKPQKGKVGGAFCANIRSIGQSRILVNFNGSFNDVRTIGHELGHAYHGFCLKNVSYLNSHYPMPLAETASIFCETIINHAALEKADKDQAISILEADISSAGQVIVDIYSRFLFESEVVKRREEGSLSVEELDEIMIESQKSAYGDGLDPNFFHKSMWVVKPHYYFPLRHFYNFPYSFGLLFAKGLFAIYQKRGQSFIKDYRTLLENTGKMTVEDVAGSIGIDLTDKDFWKGSLDVISKDITKFLDI